MYKIIIVIFLAGCYYPTIETTRTDYYDIQSRRIGYSMHSDGRVDYYDLDSRRIGYSIEEEE